MAKHIRKFFDISTAHMTAQDNDLLARAVKERDKINMALPLIRPYDHGAWVWVPDAEDMDFYAQPYSDYGFSPAFLKVLRYARENDCDWINFDSDAEQCLDLETFDW